MVDSKKAQTIQPQIYLRVYHYGSLYNFNIHFWEIFDHLFYVQCKQKCADRMKPRINALENHKPKIFPSLTLVILTFSNSFCSLFFFLYTWFSKILGLFRHSWSWVDKYFGYRSLAYWIYWIAYPTSVRVQLHLITTELFNVAFSWTDIVIYKPSDIVTYRTRIGIH